MKQEGYSDYTIRFTGKALRFLSRRCNLNVPEDVKQFISIHETTSAYKRNLVYAYERYMKLYGLEWKRPRYWVRERLPKIPLESKIDMIIAAAYPGLALQLRISKETGYPTREKLEGLNLKEVADELERLNLLD